MQPVVTVAEMRAADAASAVPEAVLVRRAGTAVALAAARLLGAPYGARVVVLAGKGNNGADGRVAAGLLRRRGAAVSVVGPAPAGSVAEPLAPCDLVIDACLGTGFSGSFDAPEVPGGAAVLAVDIPSGVDGDSGCAPGRPMPADVTVTFAARKPGLLQGDGPRFAGRVVVADIGLDVGAPAISLMEDADVGRLLPAPGPSSHKWASAVAVVAGSPGMEGAAVLASAGAARAGAGMVRLGVPGGGSAPWPLEAVRMDLPATGWADAVLEVLGRCRALVIGPGLGRSDATVADIRSLVGRSPVPVVVDADALYALGDAASARQVLAGARPVVLTPHDGEYARLLGAAPGPDRVAAARRLAGLGAVGLVKGSLTAVGAPGGGDAGPVALSSSGSARLATAGTGDVLSGVIGALIGRGVPAFEAAALGAHVHGRAAGLGLAQGLVSPDLPVLVARVLSAASAAPEQGGPDRPGGAGTGGGAR